MKITKEMLDSIRVGPTYPGGSFVRNFFGMHSPVKPIRNFHKKNLDKIYKDLDPDLAGPATLEDIQTVYQNARNESPIPTASPMFWGMASMIPYKFFEDVAQRLTNDAVLPQLTKTDKILAGLATGGVAGGTYAGLEKLSFDLKTKGQALYAGNTAHVIDSINAWLPFVLGGTAAGIYKGVKAKKAKNIEFLRKAIDDASYTDILFGKNIAVAKQLDDANLINEQRKRTLLTQAGTGIGLGTGAWGVKQYVDNH